MKSRVVNLRREFAKLRGKTLGCFCKPAACHGDIIVRVVEEIA